MNKSHFISIVLLFLLSYSLQSQTATEAFRLAESDPLGSARNVGVGNSMYTIGADLSAIANNPAGIGAYWRSEFMGTLDLTWSPYDSRLQGDNEFIPSHGNYDFFRMPNFGFVITSHGNDAKLATSNWAIGVNRLAEYAKEIHFSGRTVGSITDSWQENAFGLDSSQLNGFEEGLAYTSGAIYDFESDHIYETDYDLNPTYPLFKEEYSTVRGGKSEIYIGYGANISRKFLFGLSLNFPIVNADVTRYYTEIDGQDGTPFFNDLAYSSYVNTSGYGINGKFGFIIKPSKYVNLSFAAHTPTKLQLFDNFNTILTYDYTDANHDGPITSSSDYGNFHYALVTPWKLVGGIAIIAGTNGFISAGIQWTDYSSMHYDYSVNGNGYYYDQQERDVNASIRQTYSSAFQLNVGGEIAFKTFRLRGGFSAVQSPYLNDDSFDPTIHAGLGYRFKDFYFDLAYSYSQQDEGYLPYEVQEATQPVAVLEYKVNRMVTTVGLKF